MRNNSAKKSLIGINKHLLYETEVVCKINTPPLYFCLRNDILLAI